MKCIPAPASEALELMERALVLLDGSEMPGDIAAHLDLAVERLRCHLNVPRENVPLTWTTPLNS